jgi:RNA polymerase sigma factor (sigma-70 family)
MKSSAYQRLDDIDTVNINWQEFYAVAHEALMNLARAQFNLSLHDAQDVVQEVIIAMHNHIISNRFDASKGKLKSWMIHFGKWRIIDIIRRNKNRNARFDALEDAHVECCASKDAGVVHHLIEQEDHQHRMQVIKLALKAVPSKKYQAIFLDWITTGDSPQQLAAKHKVPISQIYLAKHRAKAIVQHQIQQMNHG